MINRVGQRLGNYRLIRLLGAGGFAEVYLGEHIHLGTQAAIKVLYTQLGRNDIEHFRAEARTIAHLEHPHIVRVLDFGVEGTTPFLVMSYASKGTLRTRHPKGTRLSLAPVVSYVQQVASALQYAHDRKLIHRDVKPENLLLGRSDEILLSDFGIALVNQSSQYQSTRKMAGTIAYMAPEQIEAHPRPASDQYALGIVVYEWLSGDRPFDGSLSEIAVKHSVVPPPSLREKVSTLSPVVEQVIMTALAKDPRQRFGRIQTFADALREAAQLPPNIVTLGPTSEVRMVAPPIPSKPVSQLPSDPKPEILVRDLPNKESIRFEPARQTANVPVTHQESTPVLYAVPPETARSVTSLSPPKRRPGKMLIGGVLGLLLLLMSVIVITIWPIIAIHRGSSTSGTQHSVPSVTPVQGEQQWNFRTGSSVDSSPTVVDGVLYVGSGDSSVYAIDARTGQQKWAFATGGSVASSPMVVNGVLYVGSSDSLVYALDARTGQEKWVFATGGPVVSSPKIVDGVLYVGSDDKNVYGIDARTGQEKWVFATSGYVRSSPEVVNGVIYIGSWDHQVYGIDARTGQEKWAFATGGHVGSSPKVVNGMLYVGSDDGNVYMLDANTGQEKWTFATGSYVESSPTVVNGVLYIGSDKVYALDARTGQEKWIFATGFEVRSSPTVVNDIVYIGSDKLYGIDARTGQEKWVFPTGNAVASSPIIVNGVLYVGSDDGKVYAVMLPASSS